MSAGAAALAARGRGAAAAWAQALTLAALAAYAYHATAATLWRTWTTNDNYSHGPLVPLVSLVLVWRRRAALAAAPRVPEARGLAWVAAACAMQVTGVRADLFALQGWSLLPLLVGLTWTFLGRRHVRLLLFPILYLAFMLTFPPFVMNQLSYALKEVAVRLATAGAQALGVTLQRAGMTLYLVTGTLRIENPCGGLRSLVALLATGTLFAYVQPGGGWRRLAVLAAAPPIAILGNAARILLVIVAAHYRSVEWATGAFHDLTGYLLYAVALALLVGARRALSPRVRAA